MVFSELLTLPIYSFNNGKVMTMMSASSPHLCLTSFILGEGTPRLFAFVSFKLSVSLPSFLLDGRFPSQVSGGSSHPLGEEERMRTVKNYP